MIAPQCAKASRNMVSVTKFASVGRFEMKTDFPLLAVAGARRGGALRLISTGLMGKEAVWCVGGQDRASVMMCWRGKIVQAL